MKHPTSSQLPMVAKGEDGAVGVNGAVVVVVALFNSQKIYIYCPGDRLTT